MSDPRELDKPTRSLRIDSIEEDGFIVPPGWYGFVAAAGPGILRRALVPHDLGMIALQKLASPDPSSRSAEFEGRRLVRVDGGFIVLNYMKYRERDYTAAERMRRYRKKHRRKK